MFGGRGQPLICNPSDLGKWATNSAHAAHHPTEPVLEYIATHGDSPSGKALVARRLFGGVSKTVIGGTVVGGLGNLRGDPGNHAYPSSARQVNANYAPDGMEASDGDWAQAPIVAAESGLYLHRPKNTASTPGNFEERTTDAPTKMHVTGLPLLDGVVSSARATAWYRAMVFALPKLINPYESPCLEIPHLVGHPCKHDEVESEMGGQSEHIHETVYRTDNIDEFMFNGFSAVGESKATECIASPFKTGDGDWKARNLPPMSIAPWEIRTPPLELRTFPFLLRPV